MTPTVRNTILSAIVGSLMTLGACALHEDIDQISYESGADTNPNNTNNVQDMPADLPVDDMTGDMIVPIDMFTEADMPDMTDTDVPDMMPDGGGDMAESDMQPDMNQGNFGMTCPAVDTSPLQGSCDVVNDTTCPTGFACAVVLTSGPPDISFGTGCLQIDSPEPWTQQDGESCSAARCVAGHQCVMDVCRKYCRLADAEGCDPDEFCEQINAETTEFGVCVPACN